METKKKCNKCGEEKSLDNFTKDKTRADGFFIFCRKCKTKWQREYCRKNKEKRKKYYDEHKEYFAKKNKEYRDRIPDKKKFYKDMYWNNREDFKRRKIEYYESPRGRMMDILGGARRRAKKLGLEFNLDHEWLMDKYNKNNGRCELTKIPFDLKFDKDRGHKFNALSPSLERINPHGGYTKDNVKLACTAINIALNKFDRPLMKKIFRAYLKHNKEAV